MNKVQHNQMSLGNQVESMRQGNLRIKVSEGACKDRNHYQHRQNLLKGQQYCLMRQQVMFYLTF